MLHLLLIYRLLILNLIGAVLFGLAFQKGWVMVVVDGDATRIVYLMAALFAAFMVSLFIRAAKVSGHLYRLKQGRSVGTINPTKFLEKLAHLDDIPQWLVTLGLLGTVIGVSIALAGVDQHALQSAEGVKKVVTALITGMRVALYTTIVGGILGLWCDFNRRMLKTAAVLMLEDAKAADAPRPVIGA